MPIKLGNNASAHLAAPLAADGDTIVLVSAEAGNFPGLSAGEWFPLTLTNSAGDIEVTKVTARSSNILTATRAQEGTSARAWLAGDRAEIRLTAGAIAQLVADTGTVQDNLDSYQASNDAALGSLSTTVATKAAQADLNTLSTTVAGLASSKANQSDLTALTATVSTKADQSTVNSIAAVPVGAVLPFAGGSAPSGFLLCFGQAVSRTGTTAALFALLGTTYGAGDGSTTFNVPDLRGRAVAGKDNMGGTAANRLTTAGSSVDGATLGAPGGAQTHTLTVAQIPSHDHGGNTANDGTHAHSINGGSNISGNAFPSVLATTSGNGFGTIAGGGAHAHSISAQGGGGAHNNVQPTIVLNYIIKV